jgi:hypothetical protein
LICEHISIATNEIRNQEELSERLLRTPFQGNEWFNGLKCSDDRLAVL